MYAGISEGNRLPDIINGFSQNNRPRAITQAARGLPLIPDNVILSQASCLQLEPQRKARLSKPRPAAHSAQIPRNTEIQWNVHSRRPTAVLKELTDAYTLERARKLGK